MKLHLSSFKNYKLRNWKQELLCMSVSLLYILINFFLSESSARLGPGLFSPQGCSPHGSPLALYHPVATGSCTLSLCRRSCPQCRQPTAPPGVCGTLKDCSRPCGPARIASSAPTSGRRRGHCRRPEHLHQHSPAAGRNKYARHKEATAKKEKGKNKSGTTSAITMS